MAASLPQGRAMVAASERARKLYMVSQSRRYTPGLQALRGLVVEHVGAPGMLNSDFFIGAHFGGLNALDTGSTPMGECHDNIKSLAMVFAALESAARRERVAISV